MFSNIEYNSLEKQNSRFVACHNSESPFELPPNKIRPLSGWEGRRGRPADLLTKNNPQFRRVSPLFCEQVFFLSAAQELQ